MIKYADMDRWTSGELEPDEDHYQWILWMLSQAESAPRDHQQQILHKLAIVVRDWQESEKQS